MLERAEGSAEGFSFLTTRNVYGWRQNHEDGIVAREFSFAQGKREDIFSPAHFPTCWNVLM